MTRCPRRCRNLIPDGDGGDLRDADADAGRPRRRARRRRARRSRAGRCRARSSGWSVSGPLPRLRRRRVRVGVRSRLVRRALGCGLPPRGGPGGLARAGRVRVRCVGGAGLLGLALGRGLRGGLGRSAGAAPTAHHLGLVRWLEQRHDSCLDGCDDRGGLRLGLCGEGHGGDPTGRPPGSTRGGLRDGRLWLRRGRLAGDLRLSNDRLLGGGLLEPQRSSAVSSSAASPSATASSAAASSSATGCGLGLVTGSRLVARSRGLSSVRSGRGEQLGLIALGDRGRRTGRTARRPPAPPGRCLVGRLGALSFFGGLSLIVDHHGLLTEAAQR